MNGFKTSTTRLISLDALRGFNMFWIIGAERITHILSKMNFPGARLLAVQLSHSRWNGFTFYDLIFPMFIFLVGISAALSVIRSREKGTGNDIIIKHILTRTLWMFLIGILVSNLNLPLGEWLANLRWMGVLQRIALCYCGVALLTLYATPVFQAAFALVLLIGYWLLVVLVPVPGLEVAVLNYPGANLPNYIDSICLPGRLYYQTWDPEGLLSTIPAVATCILGVLTGYWLKLNVKIRDRFATKEQKALGLAVAGCVAVGCGLLWGTVFPINKKIWTSSFVLLTGGISALLMAVFYWWIDIRGRQKWVFPFVVIGRNPIFIYLFANIIPFQMIADWVSERRYLAQLGNGRYLLVAMAIVLFEWLILYLMNRKKIFLRL